MSISIISDLHITSNECDGFKAFIKFINHDKVRSSDSIYLLGDIFDVFLGSQSGYIVKYSEFFKEIEKQIELGKKIVFFKGNHDFSYKSILDSFKKNQQIHMDFYRWEKIDIINGKKYYFSHGDFLDYDNSSYRLYIKLISSWPILKIASIIPFNVLNTIGEWASKSSSYYGKKKFNYLEYKEKFRIGFKRIAKEYKVDTVVCGHTHIHEDFKCAGKHYLNNGYPPRDNYFIYIDGVNDRLISL